MKQCARAASKRTVRCFSAVAMERSITGELLFKFFGLRICSSQPFLYFAFR